MTRSIIGLAMFYIQQIQDTSLRENQFVMLVSSWKRNDIFLVSDMTEKDTNTNLSMSGLKYSEARIPQQSKP